MTTTTNAVVTVSGMDSGGSIPLETFEYGVSNFWLQTNTYSMTLIPDELLGGTKTTSRSYTKYTNVSFTLQKKCEVYAYYPQWMNTQTQALVNVLDGMSFDPIDTTLILGMANTYNTNFSADYWFNVRKRMFSEGTHVFPSLGHADGNNNGFITLVFVPFSGTEISIDGILVANIDTPRNRMTENSDILPEEFQGFPTYSYTVSDTYTNNFFVEVIEDVEVYVFTPASVDLTSLGFETYTSTTTDSVWKKEFKKGTSEILDMTDGVILVFKPSITELTTTFANIQNNQWNYLSFTFDKSAKTCKVFINETEVARADNINTDIIGTDFTNIKIGEGFEGCVDEVGIYNAALPPAMIASLKNNESYIDDFLKSGVVGNWDFSLMSSNADNGVFYADNNTLANPATASGVVERGSLSGHRSVKFDPDNATTGYLTVSNSGIDASNLSVALWVNPSSNDQTIVKKNNVFEVRIDSNRNPRMEIGDNTIPVNMTTVDVGVADTTLVGHFKFDGDLSNSVVDGTAALYPLGPLVFGDDKFIQLDGSNYVDIGTNIIPADTLNLSMSMWVDISSLPENGKLPLISVATGVNESLEWSLTRVGDSVKTDLEFVTRSLVLPVEIPFTASTFELSLESAIDIDTNTNSSTHKSKSHMLTIEQYNLPLYVECELLLSGTGQNIIIGPGPILGTTVNMKHPSGNISWGSGAYTTRYSYGVAGSGGIQSDANTPQDPTWSRTIWSKFSIYVDAEKVIMYQHDGDEKYRFARNSSTESFWASSSFRVGTWSYDGGDFRNLKIGHINMWEIDTRRIDIYMTDMATVDGHANVLEYLHFYTMDGTQCDYKINMFNTDHLYALNYNNNSQSIGWSRQTLDNILSILDNRSRGAVNNHVNWRFYDNDPQSFYDKIWISVQVPTNAFSMKTEFFDASRTPNFRVEFPETPTPVYSQTIIRDGTANERTTYFTLDGTSGGVPVFTS